MIDLVDSNDNVTGKTLRSEIYAKLLPHRVVHVLVFNTKGEIALQKRGKHLRYCPLHWTYTAGGHVKSDETYEQAAAREAEEELGVPLQLKLLRKDWYTDARPLNKFMALFLCRVQRRIYSEW